MKILNLACNGHRPSEPFVNVDILHTQLLPGTAERNNLNAETNYIEHDLLKPLPFENSSCDGILVSHFLEHLHIFQSVDLIKECHRVLISDGVFVASVPDGSYFRKVYDEDSRETAKELFGEPIVDPLDGIKFFDYALFYHEHRQILTEDSLWCLMRKGGFRDIWRYVLPIKMSDSKHKIETYDKMIGELNRLKFSIVMWAVK